MKNTLRTIGLIAISIVLLATKNSNSQGFYSPGLKIGVFANVSEYDGDYTNKDNMFKFKYNKPRFGIHLTEYLNPSFTIEQRIQLFTVEYKPNTTTGFTAHHASLNLNLRYNLANGYLLKQESMFNPFLIAGIGGVNFTSTKMSKADNAINLQTGGGVMMRINNRFGIELSSIVNWVQNDVWDGLKGTDNYNDIALVHSVGLVFNFSKEIDTDGDGVIDSKDKCPNVAGDVNFDGCPAPKKVVKEEVKKRLEFAARSILFESSKAVIRPKSFPMLNEVVAILKEYNDYSLRMLGHTDNTGNDDANLYLSQARVDAVKAYLMSKGVSENRIDAVGYGSTKPITTNDTPAGRTENRRVEMELFLK